MNLLINQGQLDIKKVTYKPNEVARIYCLKPYFSWLSYSPKHSESRYSIIGLSAFLIATSYKNATKIYDFKKKIYVG